MSTAATNSSEWCMLLSAGLDASSNLCGRNYSVVNVTDLYHPMADASGYMMMVLYPLLLICSTVGNLFCLHLFLTQKRRTSQVVMLMVLCLANVVVVWLELPGYLGLNYHTFRQSVAFMSFIDGTMGLIMWMQQSFALISNGMLLLYTVERLLVIAKPALVATKLRSRHSSIISALIALLAILISLPNLIYYSQWSTHMLPCPLTMAMMCDWLTPWTHHRRSPQLALFDYITPLVLFLLLITLNLVFYTLFHTVRRRKRVLEQPEAVRRKDLTVTSRMLWRSVLLYLVTHTPLCLFSTLVLLSSHPACVDGIAVEMLALCAPLVRLVYLVNYSVNFLLYIGMAKSYRKWKQVPDAYQMVPLGESSGKNALLFTAPKRPVMETVFEPMKKTQSFYIPKKVGNILSDQQLQELWMFLPFRRRIFHPKLVFTTDEDGTSITNFLNSLDGIPCSILVIRTMDDEIFGAFCGSSWSERVHGKKEYLFFGTGETFLFAFLDDKIKVFPWIGLCGRKAAAESSLFMAADARTLIVGGGGGDAISFDSSLYRGFSSSCLTFNNPPLCSDGEFETAVLEVYAFTDDMV